jgi:hypothetical protein
LKQALVEFGKFCAAREVFMVAISSNSVLSHPQDGPERMAEDARLVAGCSRPTSASPAGGGPITR